MFIHTHLIDRDVVFLTLVAESLISLTPEESEVHLFLPILRRLLLVFRHLLGLIVLSLLGILTELR